MKIAQEIKRLSTGVLPPFAGKSKISLDGRILALDSRKDNDIAVIVLTAGGRQIECKVDKIPDEEMLRYYKKRCTIYGTGHYSGNDRLPDWVQIHKIEIVPTGGDWSKWRGALPLAEGGGEAATSPFSAK